MKQLAPGLLWPPTAVGSALPGPAWDVIATRPSRWSIIITSLHATSTVQDASQHSTISGHSSH